MDLNKIKMVLNSLNDDKTKEHLILSIIAESDNADEHLLKIICSKNKKKEACMLDLNLALSSAYCALYDESLAKMNKDKDYVKPKMLDAWKKHECLISPIFDIEELKEELNNHQIK